MKKKGPAFRGRPKINDIAVLFHRQRGLCSYCKRAMTLGDGGCASATRDHVVPRSAGGRQKGNLVAACARCNSAKGSMSAAEFRAWLRLPSPTRETNT